MENKLKFSFFVLYCYFFMNSSFCFFDDFNTIEDVLSFFSVLEEEYKEYPLEVEKNVGNLNQEKKENMGNSREEIDQFDLVENENSYKEKDSSKKDCYKKKSFGPRLIEENNRVSHRVFNK